MQDLFPNYLSSDPRAIRRPGFVYLYVELKTEYISFVQMLDDLRLTPTDPRTNKLTSAVFHFVRIRREPHVKWLEVHFFRVHRIHI